MTKDYSYPETGYETYIKAPVIDIDVCRDMAKRLIKANNPLIITGHSGRNQQTVSELVLLAETLCTRVMTADVWIK